MTAVRNVECRLPVLNCRSRREPHLPVMAGWKLRWPAHADATCESAAPLHAGPVLATSSSEAAYAERSERAGALAVSCSQGELRSRKKTEARGRALVGVVLEHDLPLWVGRFTFGGNEPRSRCGTFRRQSGAVLRVAYEAGRIPIPPREMVRASYLDRSVWEFVAAVDRWEVCAAAGGQRCSGGVWKARSEDSRHMHYCRAKVRSDLGLGRCVSGLQVV